MALRCDLQNRSNSVVLPRSATAGSAGALTEILRALPAGDSGSTWRTIELWSFEGVPWEATVEWSGGRLGPRVAYILVQRSTRICINANMVAVSGANLSTTKDISANVAIEDGAGQYQNQWVLRGTSMNGGSDSNTPPPFAQFVRLELSDETKYAAAYLELSDAAGVLRARYAGDKQPNPGVPIGDAILVTAVLPAGVNYRLTYLLGL